MCCNSQQSHVTMLANQLLVAKCCISSRFMLQFATYVCAFCVRSIIQMLQFANVPTSNVAILRHNSTHVAICTFSKINVAICTKSSVNVAICTLPKSSAEPALQYALTYLQSRCISHILKVACIMQQRQKLRLHATKTTIFSKKTLALCRNMRYNRRNNRKSSLKKRGGQFELHLRISPASVRNHLNSPRTLIIQFFPIFNTFFPPATFLQFTSALRIATNIDESCKCNA